MRQSDDERLLASKCEKKEGGCGAVVTIVVVAGCGPCAEEHDNLGGRGLGGDPAGE